MIPESRDRDSFELNYAYDIDIAGEKRSSPRSVRRTIRAVALDRFEVSVSRFRTFLRAFDQAGYPQTGQGAHPAFPESGWNEEWRLTSGVLPDNTMALENDLRAQGQSVVEDFRGDLPVRGVNWYVAFAFCIWDHARLPTEAEWAYAALGGDQGREYPWSNDLGQPISHNQALYSDKPGMLTEPAPVGKHPSGAGRFGHDDLAGNLIEWVADSYDKKLATSCGKRPDALDEHECLERGEEESRVLRGGSYIEMPELLLNAVRMWTYPNAGRPSIGFRCARNLPPY